MPYGVSKNMGGDSPANDNWMERCVNHLLTKGADKVTAVKICKATMEKSRG